MTKGEIIEEIKNEIDNYSLIVEIESYIKGYLDALCKTYEITWDERYEIEEEFENERIFKD